MRPIQGKDLLMKFWYTIKNREGSNGKPAELSIHDEIGFWGLTAKDFENDLKGITASAINISINSPGGSVFDGLAIFNMLRASGKTINTNVLGIAASIASVIQQAVANGGKRTMPENTMIMVHNPSGITMGTAEDMRETADLLDKIGNSLVGIYVKATGKSEDDVRAMLAKDTFLTAQEALDAGFIDEITDAVEVTAGYEVDRLPENVKALFKAQQQEQQQDPEPEPQGDPEPEANPVVDQIKAIIDKAGLSDYTSVFALDPNITTPEQAKVAVAEARDINALCAMVGKTDMAPGFIKARSSYADARAKLAEVLASKDVEQPTDSAQPNPNKDMKAKGGDQSKPATVSTVWAAYNKRA